MEQSGERVGELVSLGPYAVSLTKMTREEWRVAASSGWHHFKDEMAHYWAGTKLLWVEIKIATRCYSRR